MIDVNKPVTNADLVSSMNVFFENKNAENELILIGEINKAHFLVPVIVDGKIKNGVIKKKTTISFKMITNTANENFFIAFTDWQELGKWSKNSEQTLILTYNELKEMVLKDIANVRGFVINPYGQNLIITPEAMEYFSKRKSEVTIEKDTKILLGQPANYPDEMVKALTEFFKEHKEVNSCYLFWAHREDENNGNLLLVVDFTGNKDELFPRIAAVAQNYLGQDEYIDMISIGTDFGKNVVKDVKPFYKKKRFLK
ncbi:enhanced serine sensitivity protein SseB [Clostridium sp. 19966]|uniref:enhanced serine sensitivity protein SseB n=1 Tax=Clostridium sp. 19966 TaxID=2768166 RepID=UPI0028DF63F0|nr:enhanced serine sensitivity protein SseB [Clostridium sp. 19966]MDT8718003.1 enhanced serine sensitivity protein SseB [Clostridium sp. 19966]